MSDIVERLRAAAKCKREEVHRTVVVMSGDADIYEEAADEIERLRRENRGPPAAEGRVVSIAALLKVINAIKEDEKQMPHVYRQGKQAACEEIIEALSHGAGSIDGVIREMGAQTITPLLRKLWSVGELRGEDGGEDPQRALEIAQETTKEVADALLALSASSGDGSGSHNSPIQRDGHED